jgi:hypothetical protein
MSTTHSALLAAAAARLADFGLSSGEALAKSTSVAVCSSELNPDAAPPPLVALAWRTLRGRVAA